ncbi:MAG: monovalent cation/H(+) antiporter subunit G [Bacteroidales bacterium]|nr:monovalent cation/H(+) antiporter subunit G [Bacteroidales bacterium]MBN2821311.1 monovalent cation/H(+) antiporter subunit G [Bacteroidales bacterium]
MNEISVGIILLLGALFILIASIGLIRFKDILSRMHATTKATSFGILLLLIAVSLYFGTYIVTLKSILIIIFVYLTAPLAAHSVAKSFIDNNNKTD